MFEGADEFTLGALLMGAGAGLVLAVVLRALLLWSGKRIDLMLLAVPLVALGLYAGPDVIDQLGGNEVRADQILRDFDEEATRHPMLARIFADFPELRDAVRVRAADAYRQGGKQAFQEAMRMEGASLEDQVLPYYIARANDGLIVTWLMTMPPLADSLAGTDPALCTHWFFPGADSAADGTTAAPHVRGITAIVGDGLVTAYQDALNALIARSGRTPFSADAGWGKVTLSALSQSLIADHGTDTVEMLARVRAAASPEEETRLCLAISDFYARLSALDEAEAANAVRAAMGAPTP